MNEETRLLIQTIEYLDEMELLQYCEELKTWWTKYQKRRVNLMVTDVDREYELWFSRCKKIHDLGGVPSDTMKTAMDSISVYRAKLQACADALAGGVAGETVKLP